MKKIKLLSAAILSAVAAVTLSGCYFNSATATFHFGSSSTETPTHTVHVDEDGDGLCDECGVSVGGDVTEEFTYKTPTVDYSVWQEYTGEQCAAEDVSSKTVVYQFTLEDAELSEGRVYDVIVNLYSDGFAQIRQYMVSGGTATIYYGYWANMNDENLYLGITCHSVTMFDPCPVYGISYSYSLVYEEGAFASFGINLALGFAEGGQFVRNSTVSGDGSVVYQTNADFEAHIGFTQGATTPYPSDEEEDPDDDTDDSKDGVLFSWTSDSENYLLDFYEDGTYKFTFKTAGLEETGTWSWQSWKMTLTDSNGTVTEATMDEAHTLNLTFVAAINSRVTRDFSCTSDIWGNALGSSGSYNP